MPLALPFLEKEREIERERAIEDGKDATTSTAVASTSAENKDQTTLVMFLFPFTRLTCLSRTPPRMDRALLRNVVPHCGVVLGAFSKIVCPSVCPSVQLPGPLSSSTPNIPPLYLFPRLSPTLATRVCTFFMMLLWRLWQRRKDNLQSRRGLSYHVVLPRSRPAQKLRAVTWPAFRPTRCIKCNSHCGVCWVGAPYSYIIVAQSTK